MQPDDLETGTPRLEVGQPVRARGQCWRVQHVHAYPACRIVTLDPMHRDERLRSITLITPFDRLMPVRRTGRWNRCGLRRVVARLARALRETLAGGAGQLLGPDLSLVPWQWSAATAVLRGEASVLLLADVVGLGKTIQAALVIAALRTRGEAGRVLILAPAGLREQWQSELERLFLLPCRIADAAWLRTARRTMPASVNPWSAPGTMIASIDFVKQPEVLAAATGAPWDVLVVDEAHTLGARTDRRAAAGAVACCARHVLLLTATPHGGSEEEFAALCGVGALAGDDAQAIGIRRTRSDVGLDASRRVRVARVALTGAERRMHLLVREYASTVWRERGTRSTAARLAMTVLLKRAASSAWALHCSVTQRLRLLGPEEELPDQPPLPFDDPGETDATDSEPPAVLGEPGLDEPGRELHLLAELLDAAAVAASSESKFARVATLLRRTSESAVVFTEYRDTLQGALRALAASGPIAVLHGGLSRVERRQAEGAFTAGRARVLLATDVASEGLNLHGRCRLVINLELPWSPVRLEQRIGRVDRIGQGRRVHAVHVVGRDTTESYVLERLATRLRQIRRSLGNAYDARPIPDTLLAAGALGHEELPAPDVPYPASIFRPSASPDRSDRELCELLDWARRVGAAAGLPARGLRRIEQLPVAEVQPRARVRLGLEPGIALGFQVSALSAGGRAVAARVVMVHIALAPAAFRGAPPSVLVAGVVRLAHRAAVREVIDALEPDLDAHRRHAARSSARESALLTAAAGGDCGPRSAPVQPGLFDRRALKEAARQRAAREHRRQLHTARLAQLALERNVEPELRAEPILALVLR